MTSQPREVTKAEYDPVAKLLHWLMALLLSSIFALGLYMTGLSFSPEKLKLISWHKWAGIIVLALVILRLLWRLTHRPPAMPTTMGRWQAISAHLGHLGLYLLLVMIPVSGWLMSSAKGVPTVLFGLWPLPDLVQRDRDLGDLLQSAHWYLNVLLVVMVMGHVAAALKHHFIDKDTVLKRMLPRAPHQ